MNWISVEDKLPENGNGKFFVKKENSEEISAFFMPDKIQWVAFYGRKTSYWMTVDSGELIHNVKYWKPYETE